MYHMRQAPEVFFFLLLLILQYLTLDGILSIHISGVVHSTAANFLSGKLWPFKVVHVISVD